MECIEFKKTHKSAAASFIQAGSLKVRTDDTQVRCHEVKLHEDIALYFLHVFCVWMMSVRHTQA